MSIFNRVYNSVRYRVYHNIRSRILKIMNSKHMEYAFYYYYRYFVFTAITLTKDQKPRVLFGPCPIINNKYWANALKFKGYKADSIAYGVPTNNTKKDFDLLIEDLFPINGEPNNWKLTRQKLRVFNFIIKEYDIFVMAFRFNFFDGTVFFNREASLMKKYGKKVVIIPYGSDFYKYSKIIDQSLKHNLMINMPAEVFNEKAIIEKVDYWTIYADFMIMGVMVDDASRWDILPVSPLCIDVDLWKRGTELRKADGVNEAVTIVHSPNHRGFKGTEFILQAVQELKDEGLKIDFVLLEKVPNEVVRNTLTTTADILVEQIIFTGYGLSGVEGMASGIPVMSNWEHKDISTLFRRYSYLNECPIVSTSPETIKENLRKLITNPSLRKHLGDAGREYVEKYNSYKAFSALFGEIERKIWWEDPESDPMNFFNSTNQKSYNHKYPIIRHPLKQNRIPDKLELKY